MFAGGENVVDWDFTLNELVPGEPLTAPVQALRCDGHQHAGNAIHHVAMLFPSSNCFRASKCWVCVSLSNYTHIQRDGHQHAGAAIHPAALSVSECDSFQSPNFWVFSVTVLLNMFASPGM